MACFELAVLFSLHSFFSLFSLPSIPCAPLLDSLVFKAMGDLEKKIKASGMDRDSYFAATLQGHDEEVGVQDKANTMIQTFETCGCVFFLITVYFIMYTIH